MAEDYTILAYELLSLCCPVNTGYTYELTWYYKERFKDAAVSTAKVRWWDP